MKPGELRTFRIDMRFSHDARRVSGKTFVVVDVQARGVFQIADFLVDGQVEREWDALWVESNSEVLSAEG